jgi:3-phenylpropionate/trans-cinnamate dioxygenase ferredoxin reductase component
MPNVVIVGASLAGLTAAETLRGAGYEAPIVVVDPSPEVPSDRPPLSKQVLAGDWEPEKARHRSAARLPDLDLDLRLGVAATGLDVATRTLELSDGTSVAADGIVLAMGAAARHLPGPRPRGVHVLRTMEDCLALRADLDRNPARVAVIGAGFIGAEVAATCRGRGLEVTMIEAGATPLNRVLPAAVGSFITDLHTDNGVDVRLGVGVDGLEIDGGDDDGRVTGVRLGDGSVVPAEVVVVGIGVVPNTGWLEGSGLTLTNGVSCDATCLAAPGIVAAGDVASWPNPRYDEVMRVEQWENAIEQGEYAAKRLLAELGAAEVPAPFAPVPWFWSDQYDRKLQMAGRPAATDELVIPEGSIEERRFVAMFRRGEQCSAVLGVSRPRHVMQVRMKLMDSLDWDTAMSVFN